jgi:xanthine dehydrogenase small subunit
VVAALTALQNDGPAPLNYAALLGARVDHFHAPKTLAQLAALREQKPRAQLLAGSTDVGLWVNKQFRDLGDIIYVGDVAEMKTIEDPPERLQGGELYIGAGASLESAFEALVQRVPSLEDVWLRFASPPIRHAGTMGGNVANGSPIGDSPPVLMSLDTEIELRRGDVVRRMPLPDFYIDYMKNQLQPGEFVQGLAIPLAAMRRQVRAYKISKRFDCDISALCAGFAIELEEGSDTVKAVRLAFGGMAATVKRAAGAEAALVGKPWTQASVATAKLALAQDFKPLSDMRASADYRLQVAQNLIQRLWLETRTEDALSLEETSVWSVMPHAAVKAAAARSLTMNKPIDARLLQPAEAFADYLKNTAARIDQGAEAVAHDLGARVGISRPHESAHLHVAGEATYIDDIPELTGTLHCALGLSPIANGRVTALSLDAIRAMPGVVTVLTADDIPGTNDCGSIIHDDPILLPVEGRR